MTRPLVLFPFLGSGIGGSHISAFILGQALQKRGWAECQVLFPEGSAIAAEAARYGLQGHAVPERPAQRHGLAYEALRLVPRLQELSALARRPCLLHLNDVGALQSWGPSAKALRLPLVYHHRSLSRPVWQNRLVLSLADQVISISDACSENLSFLPPGKVQQISNPFLFAPVDKAAARQRLARELGLPDDALVFGFIGNFWWRKRPRYFLEACRAIAAREPRARFVVFGRAGELTGPELEACARELAIGDKTHFVGFRSPPEENVAAIDVLMAPAEREPFGRTLVEAVLSGVPYVATADGGHVEIERRFAGGVLAPQSATPEDFAATALQLAQDPALAALGSEGRAAVAESLSADRHATEVWAVYRRVLGVYSPA